MKSIIILVSIFIVAVLAWFSVVFWIPNLGIILLEQSGKCPSGDFSITSCREILSSFGATGDLFGAINSLFSGIALFAVAFTLWMQASAKQESRKPLVVTYLDADSVSLDRPVALPEPTIRFSINSKIANQTGEPALNVQIHMTVIAGQMSENIPPKSLQMPLLSGGQEESRMDVLLSGQLLQAILNSLTRDSDDVSLRVTTKYDSLEGISWSTCAIYQLRCKLGERRKRLNSFRSQTDDFIELWENDAAVPLDQEVKAGTWKHKRT